MAANYGFLNNIATGLREGLNTYQTISNMKQNQKQVELQNKFYMKQQGLMQDPETGELNYTPEKQQEIDFNRQKQQEDFQPIDEPTTGLLGQAGFKAPPGLTMHQLKGVESLLGKKLGADATAARVDVSANNQAETRDQRVHQNSLNEIEKDPNIRNLTTTYQNLDNAEKNFRMGGMSPQEFAELQQAVRANLGIKGGSGVSERQESYLRSLGLSGDSVMQFLTGDIQDVSKSDPKFVEQISKIVDIEKQNKREQAKGLLEAKKKGHASFYNKHKDLAEDYENTSKGYLSQFGNEVAPTEAAAENVSSGPKVGSIEDGHRFLGGNPADPKSWEKVK